MGAESYSSSYYTTNQIITIDIGPYVTNQDRKRLLMALENLTYLPAYRAPQLGKSSHQKARHGFQQMSRLPCYRGTRTR